MLYIICKKRYIEHISIFLIVICLLVNMSQSELLEIKKRLAVIESVLFLEERLLIPENLKN